ncbi:MAG TPA: polysaccharide biosynthesis/export family protein [Bacteroidales bacterium]|nr:polysaccharide biosynthesis/export family protein [Bacteroidales bacterium]
MKNYSFTYFFILIIISFSSCKVFDSSRMLRVKPGYPYAKLPDNNIITDEYRIAPYDKLNLILFSNQGEKIVKIMGDLYTQNNREATFEVDYDGTVRLPVIDRVHIAGMTVREAEKLIELKYSQYYQQPFALLSVSNMRVTVLRGGNLAKVVTLERPNTTLLELIAMTGGTEDIKTHKIKLVRGDLRNPEIYLIDLSTVEGLAQGGIIVQAGDIIYLPPRDKVASRAMGIITPYLTLFSSLLLIYNIIK